MLHRRAKRVRAGRRARQDRNPNPSRLRAGNHVRPVNVVAERAQHHRLARIYYETTIAAVEIEWFQDAEVALIIRLFRPERGSAN